MQDYPDKSALPKADPSISKTGGSELARLQVELEVLNRQAFFRLQNAPVRGMVRSFLNGMAFGLGSFLGATLVVSFLVYSLAQIDFIPIIGEWASQIADRIKDR